MRKTKSLEELAREVETGNLDMEKLVKRKRTARFNSIFSLKKWHLKKFLIFAINRRFLFCCSGTFKPWNRKTTLENLVFISSSLKINYYKAEFLCSMFIGIFDIITVVILFHCFNAATVWKQLPIRRVVEVYPRGCTFLCAPP